jgi:DNA-binding phage protein
MNLARDVINQDREIHANIVTSLRDHIGSCSGERGADILRVSRRCGLSPRTIRRAMEAGNGMRLDTALRLAAGLGMRLVLENAE